MYIYYDWPEYDDDNIDTSGNCQLWISIRIYTLYLQISEPVLSGVTMGIQKNHQHTLSINPSAIVGPGM